MDTQLPRWEVFKQDTPGRPHQAVGSVHAGDAQHALFTARTVFARRPQAVSLWVTPEESIFSITAEEIDLQPDWAQAVPNSPAQRYTVFRKTSHKRSMTFVDFLVELEAHSPQQAIHLAQQLHPHPAALAWWVVATGQLTQSDPDPQTVESWFEPAREKTYKQQSHYATVGSRPRSRQEPAHE